MLLGARKADHLLSLPALERPPLMDQGLESVDQPAQAAAGNLMGLVNQHIQVPNQTIHLLQSGDQPEVHDMQPGAGAGFQREILLESRNFQTNSDDHLFARLHAALVNPAGTVGLVQRLQAVGVELWQLIRLGIPWEFRAWLKRRQNYCRCRGSRQCCFRCSIAGGWPCFGQNRY